MLKTARLPGEGHLPLEVDKRVKRFSEPLAIAIPDPVNNRSTLKALAALQSRLYGHFFDNSRKLMWEASHFCQGIGQAYRLRFRRQR